VAVLERFLWAMLRRRIDQAIARFQHANNVAYHAPSIDIRLTSCIGRKVLRDFVKLLFSKPKQMLICLRFLSEAVRPNPLITPMLLRARSLFLK
jgi:hypothetical protein